MADLQTNPKGSRRGFLDYLLGLSGVAWLAGVVVYPAIRYLKPMHHSGPTGPARLTRDELTKLEQNHFVIVPVSGKRVLVFETADHQISAFDAKCTHEGCTVQFVPAQSAIWCACHNARFDLDGRVLSGPPPRALPRYVAERQPDGGIVVAIERI